MKVTATEKFKTSGMRYLMLKYQLGGSQVVALKEGNELEVEDEIAEKLCDDKCVTGAYRSFTDKKTTTSKKELNNG